MPEERAAKPTSTLKIVFYLIIGAILLTVFLEMTGMADVAGKQESEQIINRPHD